MTEDYRDRFYDERFEEAPTSPTCLSCESCAVCDVPGHSDIGWCLWHGAFVCDEDTEENMGCDHWGKGVPCCA